jgi:hypothetical protein
LVSLPQKKSVEPARGKGYSLLLLPFYDGLWTVSLLCYHGKYPLSHFYPGTYYCVLTPNVETTLTLNANGTYLLTQTFKGNQNKLEKLRGTFQVLDGSILMLVHPSSGDNIFYKLRDADSIVLLDSFGNEPKDKK